MLSNKFWYYWTWTKRYGGLFWYESYFSLRSESAQSMSACLFVKPGCKYPVSSIGAPLSVQGCKYPSSSIPVTLSRRMESPAVTSAEDLRFKTLRPRQNGRHFPDDIFKWIFLNENVGILTNISLKCVPRGLINNIPTLVQVMAWRRPGDKPLSEPIMVRLSAHIWVTQPQWVKILTTI